MYILALSFDNKQIIQCILTIICIIFSLIYLEIIELKFCKLNLNLKKNIDNRGKIEDSRILGIFSDIDSDDLN